MEGPRFLLFKETTSHARCWLLSLGRSLFSTQQGQGIGSVGGGIWGGRQLESRGKEDTSPFSRRKPFSSFLRSKVLGLVGRTQFGGKGVATGSWRREGKSGELQGSFELPGQASASSSTSQGLSYPPTPPHPHTQIQSLVPIHV